MNAVPGLISYAIEGSIANSGGRQFLMPRLLRECARKLCRPANPMFWLPSTMSFLFFLLKMSNF
jgi:hypothetical protein